MDWSVVTCILNGKARSDNASLARHQIAALIEKHGVRPRILVAGEDGDVTELAKKAAALSDIVVAGGGDGTVNGVAAALIGQKARLGVLPLGTLNHFAKDLKIPLDLEGAVANIFTGRVKPVDAGEVNGKVFLNNSSLGLYPTIVRQRESVQNQGHSKWVSFALACVSALRRSPPLSVSLHANGVREGANWSPFLFIGNNRYTATGLSIGSREQLDEGMLYIYRGHGRHRVSLLSLALSALFNRLDHKVLEISPATDFVVHSRKRQIHVATDGEVTLLKTPLHYRILPGAINVIVPEGALGA